MLDDFERALARVQGDYGFYIECQANPQAALAAYDLSDDERAKLLDPEQLAEVLKRGIGVHKLPPITIKICGTHDWINRAAVGASVANGVDVAREVEAVKRARTRTERHRATLRLMELIG